MSTSLDNYLRSLASTYYLKNSSEEVRQIDGSIKTLFDNLDEHFSYKIKRKFVFGSYDRDTILPRKFDSKSDVDIMVIFNHTEYERTPDTYRNWLKTFAVKYYQDRYGSGVTKTFPTITVRLGHIHYDLVPAKEEQLWGQTELSIPGAYGWRTTNPYDVKRRLTEANTNYNQVVRPIVRLFKAWNCYNGYPYDSYELELEVTGVNFHGDNVQTGFIYAANQLNLSSATQDRTSKVESLRYNLRQVIQALDDYDSERAKRWLHRILPTA